MFTISTALFVASMKPIVVSAFTVKEFIVPKTIVMIGDSLTFGKWENGSPELNLSDRLKLKYPFHTFVNLGNNGDTTSMINQRKEEAVQYNPDIVFVWGGINDISASRTSEEIQKDLQEIHNFYQELDYQIYAFTVTPRDNNSPQMVKERFELNDWIESKENEFAGIIDTSSIISDPNNQSVRKSEYKDGFTVNHLSDSAYKAIAEKIIIK